MNVCMTGREIYYSLTYSLHDPEFMLITRPLNLIAVILSFISKTNYAFYRTDLSPPKTISSLAS